MAAAESPMTHAGTANLSSAPYVTSARVMTPMVFCASLLPWLKDMKLADRIWSQRKPLLSGLGAMRRNSHSSASMMPKPISSPSTGEVTSAPNAVSTVGHLTALGPMDTSAAPMTPPISACDELLGSPYTHVRRFQAM